MSDESEASKRRTAFAAAGLPVPVYSAKAPGRHDDNTWDMRLGVLAHKVIGQVAPQAQAVSRADYPDLVRGVVAEVVRDKSLGRLDKARTRVTGFTLQYLREFLPSPATTFLGTELVAGRGRVDLAWQHPTIGVWFDELKTWRHTQAGFDDVTWNQVTRYLDAGITTYGDAFTGLRLLTLGNLHACVAVTRQGLIEPLADSVLAPTHLSVGAVA